MFSIQINYLYRRKIRTIIRDNPAAGSRDPCPMRASGPIDPVERAPSQDYVADGQDSLAMVGNLSREGNLGPPRGFLQ
jgi:hypothetical protein